MLRSKGAAFFAGAETLSENCCAAFLESGRSARPGRDPSREKVNVRRRIQDGPTQWTRAGIGGQKLAGQDGGGKAAADMSGMSLIFCASEAPPAPGAYALWLRLDAPLRAKAGRRHATLAAGDYLYCGSAQGPGGLRARLARHLRPRKSAHWHIDQLTAVGRPLGAFVRPGGSECALNAALAAFPVPLPGFGSSDCPRCASHLQFFPAAARLPSEWENARKAADSAPPA